MNISEVIDFLNFWINKKTNSYLTPEECIEAIDRGQMALYSDYKAKYATSQLIKDALAVFLSYYDFNTTNTVSGYIVIPSNSNYLDVLDVQIQYSISNRVFYYSVPLVNQDVLSTKLNSQVDPVTITSPLGQQTAPRYFRLFPLAGYAGTVTYFRRPTKPVFSYSIISGRVVVYDPANSVQLEWRETEIVPLLLKALMSIGINLSDAEVEQFAQTMSGGNYLGQNRL